MKAITKFLLGIENRARAYFEKIPFVQAFLAGIGVIIFWRGIWELLDATGVSPIASIILETFIGNTMIIKEVKQEEYKEEKSIQKIEGEVGAETITIAQLSTKIDAILEKMNSK